MKGEKEIKGRDGGNNYGKEHNIWRCGVQKEGKLVQERQ